MRDEASSQSEACFTRGLFLFACPLAQVQQGIEIPRSGSTSAWICAKNILPAPYCDLDFDCFPFIVFVLYLP